MPPLFILLFENDKIFTEMPIIISTFVEQLIAGDEAKRTELLLERSANLDLELAFWLKDIAQEAWTTDPTRTQQAAAALSKLSAENPDREIIALSNWANGIAALTRAENQAAIDRLENAATDFGRLKKDLLAAQTQVALLYALALRSEYDDAIRIGEKALATFLKYDDQISAAKIEKNIGNLYIRRQIYDKSQIFLESAHQRFLAVGNAAQIAMSENSLATIYAVQNDFLKAEKMYLQALDRSEQNHLIVTQAETEANLGNVAIFRGRYDDALKFLEKSRSKYSALEMPHQTAIADLEIADVYLELNLLQEAREIYKRIAPQFKALKMRAEEARTRANYGKSLARLGETEAALSELKKAAALYRQEKNNVGIATVKLILANLNLREKNYQAATEFSAAAENLFRRANSPRNVLLSQFVRGESERCLKNWAVAENTLANVLQSARHSEHPQIAWAAANSLGLLAKDAEDLHAAAGYFEKSIEIIETLRSPLGGDEFRTAFFTDKLAPYQNLADLGRRKKQIAESLGWIERARAQSLLYLLASSQKHEKLTDDIILQTKFERLREELNWFYSRLSRPASEISATESEVKNIQNEIEQRENELSALILQAQAIRAGSMPSQKKFDLKHLQKSLGQNRVLIEFAEFDHEFAAFVVDQNKVRLVERLGNTAKVQTVLEQIHFQSGTLRYGAANLRQHLPLLKKRTDQLLQNLYEMLLRPLEDLIAGKNLMIVPTKNLHYVPFHALFDGEKYLLENSEVSLAPSATLLQTLLETDKSEPNKILAVAFGDERAPQVEREVKNLTRILPNTNLLIGEAATFEAIRKTLESERFDVLHLACHGQFRPENPLFSSLRLADGWLAVRETANFKLENALVVLSACETGLSEIAAGEELLGLIRGFLAAGASALVISLWTVNDETTAALMEDFYRNLKNKKSPAASLRTAQLNFIKQKKHPYFWAPFVLSGKW